MVFVRNTTGTFLDERADPDRARTVTFAAHKGGTGRTTALVNVGAEAARLGARVLLVDFDANAVLTQSHMGVDITGNTTTADLIGDNTVGSAREALLAAPEPWQPRHDLPYAHGGALPGSDGAVAFIPGELLLGRAADQLSTVPAGERRLGRALSGVARGFDLVLVDIGANIARLNWMMMQATGSVLVVFTPEDSSLTGAVDQVQFTAAYADAYDLPVRVIGAVCAKFDRRYPSSHGTGLARVTHAIASIESSSYVEPVPMSPLLPGEDRWDSDGRAVWPEIVEQRAVALNAAADRAPMVSYLQALGQDDARVAFAARKNAATTAKALVPVQRIALRLLQGVGSPVFAVAREQFEQHPTYTLAVPAVPTSEQVSAP